MKTPLSIQLSIRLKRAEYIDLKSPLLAYIRLTFGDKEADMAADELDQIQQLRGEVLSVANAITASLSMKDLLSKYYRCLGAIETRFMIGKERGQAQLAFSWFDAFRPNKKVAQSNLFLEKSAVLFNLGATASQIALSQDRQSTEGLLVACRYFQEAAGAFHLLATGDATRLDASPKAQDLATDVTASLSKLMLAQAQECIFHKAVIDKKSPSIAARLAKQVNRQYEEVARFFHQTDIASYFDKSWAQHVDLKAAAFSVEELLQQARQCRADDEINFEIALLKEAFTRAEVCRRVAKSLEQEMVDGVVKTQEYITVSLAKAEKENGTIYLLKVPLFADVPPVAPSGLMVKAVPPSNLDVAQEQLFQGLVPDQCAKAVSRYQAMVDEVVRRELDRLAGATDTGRLRLRVAELPDLLEALDANSRVALPSSLLQELEQVERVGGITHLKELVKEIGETRAEVEEDLESCRKPLEEDAAADAAAREKYGSDRWRVPLSSTMTKPYWERISKFRASLAKARESDAGVEARLEAAASSFSGLSVEAAIAAMPRLQAPLLVTGPEDPAVLVATLRRNLGALQALATERAALEEALKADRARDDILPKVMAAPPASYDALFAADIKKYDVAVADVTANVARQTELLQEVEREAASFREIFDIRGWRANCDVAAQSSKDTVRQFRELLEHCGEGLRFYIGLAEVAKKTRTECEDFAFTRSVQRDELAQRLDAQDTADRQSREAVERQAKDERDAAWLAEKMAVAAQIGGGPAAPGGMVGGRPSGGMVGGRPSGAPMIPPADHGNVMMGPPHTGPAPSMYPPASPSQQQPQQQQQQQHQQYPQQHPPQHEALVYPPLQGGPVSRPGEAFPQPRPATHSQQGMPPPPSSSSSSSSQMQYPSVQQYGGGQGSALPPPPPGTAQGVPPQHPQPYVPQQQQQQQQHQQQQAPPPPPPPPYGSSGGGMMYGVPPQQQPSMMPHPSSGVALPPPPPFPQPQQPQQSQQQQQQQHYAPYGQQQQQHPMQQQVPPSPYGAPYGGPSPQGPYGVQPPPQQYRPDWSRPDQGNQPPMYHAPPPLSMQSIPPSPQSPYGAPPPPQMYQSYGNQPYDAAPMGYAAPPPHYPYQQGPPH